MGNFKMTK